ncbi:unnamed protein product, partial [Phaeothamnion confervicola]
ASSAATVDGGEASAADDGCDYLPAYLLSDYSLERAGRGGRAGSTMECELNDLDARRERVRQACTAGLVVIGDEILKGKTADTNTPFATRRLWEHGIPVKRVAVVPDSEAEIADEVRRQVQLFDVVITSGGVGPTHDDVTIRAVAAALGQRVRRNEDMVERLKAAFGVREDSELTEAQQKMSMLPELSKLRVAPAEEEKWPILQCENVFILPGVPQFFERKMSAIVDHFLNRRPLHRKKMVLSADEFEIVEQLDAAVAAHPTVTFGSYPYVDNPLFKTVITIEAEEKAAADAAAATLAAVIPPGLVVRTVDDDDDLRPSRL